MANVIVSVFAIALIIGSVLVVTSAALGSAGDVTQAWDRMAERNGDRERTSLTLIRADPVPTSTNVDIEVRNSGQTALRDFHYWDVIIQYYATSSNQGLNIAWLTYTTSTPPPSGQWTIDGPYLDVGALESEVYEPAIFNPGEELILRLNVTPAIPADTDNLATVGVSNGVTLAAPFSR